MSRWRKVALWSAAGVMIVLLLVALVLHSLIDKEKLKGMARDKVQTAWARDLVIKDVTLRVFPYPRLHAQQVTLSNPVWAKNKHLLEAAHIYANLDLLALMTGKAKITGLSIEELRLYPEISADGVKSWDMKRDPAAPAPPTASQSEQFPLTALSLKNAEVNFLNKSEPPRTWRIHNATATSGGGWRNVWVDAMLSRDGHLMQVQGSFADLSDIGIKGAVSDASITANWGPARVTVKGKIPLEAALQGHAFRADFEAGSVTQILGFFGVDASGNGKTAPIKVTAAMNDDQGKVQVKDLRIKVGSVDLSGSAKLDFSGKKPLVNATVQGGHLDWTQMLLDLGRPPVPPKPEGELFRTNPFPWQAMTMLEKFDGAADIALESVKMRSGVLLRNAKIKVTFDGPQLNMRSFSANLLSGSMTGNATLTSRKQSVRMKVEMTDVSLAQWYEERGKKALISEGPMKIHASFTATGGSMKELAASLTGPITVRMGNARFQSAAANQAESWLVGLGPMFSARDATHIKVECLAANLDFRAGRATADPIIGVRSDTSQLLTAGFIDFREQTLDLRGRLHAKSGVTLGISSLAGQVQIIGPIAKPDVGLDAGGSLARIGAAIMTGGASIIGTTVWDSANASNDACQQVFVGTKVNSTKGPAKPAQQSGAPGARKPQQRTTPSTETHQQVP